MASGLFRREMKRRCKTGTLSVHSLRPIRDLISKQFEGTM